VHSTAACTHAVVLVPQMAEWTEWGYFTDEVGIRNCGLMPEGVFLPLGDMFPDPGPDADDEAVAATAPFESDYWIGVWRKHLAATGGRGVRA